MKKVICSECQEAGMKSRVTCRGSSSTSLHCPAYYDEEGNYHHHDCNDVIAGYSCDKGHTWTEKEPRSCPNSSCDWPNDKK